MKLPGNLPVPAVRRRSAQTLPAAGQIVFVHGMLDDGNGLRRVADHLPRWDSNTYDRRGWGRSATPPARFADHVRDLRDILRLVGPSGIVGHSLGGLIACTVAATAPDLVRWVVAYEPPVPWLPWWPDLAPWEALVLNHENNNPEAAAERLMRAVLGDTAWEELPGTVRRHQRATGPALVAEMADLRETPPCFDPLDVRPPVLVAAGSRSLNHHRDVSRKLADLMPRGRYHEIEGAGHAAHVEHPASFARLIEQIVPSSTCPA
jgi:pimeloyl-ACP methyl ester carboxylesterase